MVPLWPAGIIGRSGEARVAVGIGGAACSPCRGAAVGCRYILKASNPARRSGGYVMRGRAMRPGGRPPSSGSDMVGAAATAPGASAATSASCKKGAHTVARCGVAPTCAVMPPPAATACSPHTNTFRSIARGMATAAARATSLDPKSTRRCRSASSTSHASSTSAAATPSTTVHCAESTSAAEGRGAPPPPPLPLLLLLLLGGSTAVRCSRGGGGRAATLIRPHCASSVRATA